jgi:hypothetical protein
MIKQSARVLVIAATLVVSTVAPTAVRACSCAGPSPVADALAQADAVFFGEAMRVQRADSWWGIAAVAVRTLWAGLWDQRDPYVDAWEESARYGRVVQFRVLERFKGIATPSVSIHTGFGEGDCGFQFAVGTEYLVYAYVETDTIDTQKRYLRTSICTRTAPARVAGDEGDELRRLTRGNQQ